MHFRKASPIRSSSAPPSRNADSPSAQDRFTPTTADTGISAIVAIAFAGIFALLVAYLPADVFDSTSDVFILTIGAISVWRYGWWFTHLLRGIVYRRHTFPRLRRIADQVDDQGVRPGRIFVLCTSYRIDPRTTYAVYEGIVRNALDYGVPTTIFAAISDRTDIAVLDAVMADCDAADLVEIHYMFQRGDGKRSAMAEVLRAIARRQPGPDDLVVFMDGDIRLPASTFRRSMPFFFTDDSLGAVTTDNRAVVSGGDFTKEWYDLRYAQRHMLMCSTSLARRVLVLTGRYSVIRADLCTRPDFIALVERDGIVHRRLGDVTFLSGDDKSTWYWLLKNGWGMRYIPDVQVYGFEELPDRNRFFASTMDLMRRWFGNMYRTSGRAISLGPRPMGVFIWWCLVDQRLSAWTTLIGPIVAILLSLLVRPSFGAAYLLWIMATRLIACALLGIPRRRFSPLWPVLLYYNQVAGSALKGYVNFRINQQKWTRQGISTGSGDTRAARRERRESALLHIASVVVLVVTVAFASGALRLPDRHTLWPFVAQERARSDNYWLAAQIRHLPEGGMVPLAAGEVHARWPTFGSERISTIAGAGPELTTLHLEEFPTSTSVAVGGKRQPPMQAMRCGPGDDACLIGDRVRLTNLTITFR